MATATGGSSSNDAWSFITSPAPAAVLARSIGTVALAGGAAYFLSRRTPSSSQQPPTPPKDRALTPVPPEDEVKKVRFEGATSSPTKPVPVAVFWDVDNCSPPSGSSGRLVVQAIRRHLASIDTGTGPEKEDLGPSGALLSFKAYLELSSAEGVSPAHMTLRSELQGSGVSLIDTPKSGRKDVADKMIIADLMAFAIDVPPPARIVLISGDRDFAYPISLLRGRGYQIVLITPPVGAVPILEASASHVARWRQDVLGLEHDGYGRPYASTPSKSYQRSSSPGPYKSSGSQSQSKTSASAPMTPSSSGQGTVGSTNKAAAPAAAPLSGPGAPPVPNVFASLVQTIREFEKEGIKRPLRSKVALRLTAIDKDVYEKAGASSWRDYVAVAVAAGIVVLGSAGPPGSEWIALRSIDPNAPSVPTSIADPVTPKKHSPKMNNAPLFPSSATPSARAAYDGSSGEIATDNHYSPDSLFEPLLHAIVAAEKACQRYPPIASVVGEHLDRMTSAPGSVDPLAMAGVRSFGSFITVAFKNRVAKLTPTEKAGVAALEVMPAYQPYLDKLRRESTQPGVSKLSAVPNALSSEAQTSSPSLVHQPSPVRKNAVFPNLFNRSKSSDDVGGDSPSAKRSAYHAGPGLLMPHQPSGAKIAPVYFPLANVLLVERAKGNFYSTDIFLHKIVSQHKQIGDKFKDFDAFTRFLEEAEGDNVISLDEGFKPGTRHVRLASRLCDPKERGQSDHLPRAGDDPYEPSDSPEQNHRSSPPVRALSDRGNVNTHTAPTTSASSSAASAQPSVQDRVRFKPLMDVMIALRKHDPPQVNPRRSLVNDILAKKHAGDRDGDLSKWFQERGASSIGDYTRQAEALGFIHCEREHREDGEQGKRNIKLAAKYEALLK